MMKYLVVIIALFCSHSFAKVAISLSYDDALASQLDIAVPALNKYQLKASFYVVPKSPSFQLRLGEWRSLAEQGHELGNHTLFHACQGSKANRDWVELHNDLDHKSVAEMVDEVGVANTLLAAVDGKLERTFTPPCFDKYAGGKNYLSAVSSMFIAIKGQEPQDFATVIVADNITATEIINFIESQPPNIKLINILMHGVGGDYLAISANEHDKLLNYLFENKARFWVDTYLNIMKSMLATSSYTSADKNPN
ncbi:polysaccharide deacetylase family protein [Thalassotalea maritima]|uniref:polysaccharide deacetylase family protein n=1 Tax=Thalassotalea maritima TaxID=3242416 RepID=UPI003527CEBB